MTVDIYIREKGGKKREMTIPYLPERIARQDGDAIFISYEILGKGEVVVPAGNMLATYSWESEFPGEGYIDKGMYRGGIKEPKAYDALLNEWKANGTLLNLLVTGYPINVDGYIESYVAEPSGGFGAIPYQISFKAIGNAGTSITTTNNTQGTTRPTTTSKTHTIKSGDTLWGIAQEYYNKGSLWTKIYEANKTIIEQTAKKYGRSFSDNGHWIYPGVVLTIPT